MTIIKKFDTSQIEEGKTLFHFSPRFVLSALSSILILVVVEIWASNTIVTYGDKLEKLTALQRSLRMQNQILENEIAKLASLAHIASESAILGFSKDFNVQYIR